jgi:hypothetical protein
MDQEDSIAGVDLSVVSMDKVTCLTIAKKDLTQILTEDMLLDITTPSYEGLIGITVEEIQQSYFDKIQWNGYRQEVVSGMIDRKSTVGKTATIRKPRKDVT